MSEMYRLLFELKDVADDLGLAVQDYVVLKRGEETIIIASAQWDVESLCRHYVVWRVNPFYSQLPDYMKELLKDLDRDLANRLSKILLVSGEEQGQRRGVTVKIVCTEKGEKFSDLMTKETGYRLVESLGKCAVYMPTLLLQQLETLFIDLVLQKRKPAIEEKVEKQRE